VLPVLLPVIVENRVSGRMGVFVPLSFDLRLLHG